MFPECVFDFVEALFESVFGVMFGLGFFLAFDAYPIDDDVEERGGNDRDDNRGDEGEGFVHAISLLALEFLSMVMCAPVQPCGW